MTPSDLERLANVLDAILDAPDLNHVEDLLTNEADFLGECAEVLREEAMFAPHAS